MSDSTSSALLITSLVLLISVSVVLHFLPTVIALARHHRNRLGIFLVNLLLGWTIFGWVAALIWAVYRDKQKT